MLDPPALRVRTASQLYRRSRADSSLSDPPLNRHLERVLEVSDLEAARRFYRDVLGFEETLYGEGRRAATGTGRRDRALGSQ